MAQKAITKTPAASKKALAAKKAAKHAAPVSKPRSAAAKPAARPAATKAKAAAAKGAAVKSKTPVKAKSGAAKPRAGAARPVQAHSAGHAKAAPAPLKNKPSATQNAAAASRHAIVAAKPATAHKAAPTATHKAAASHAAAAPQPAAPPPRAMAGAARTEAPPPPRRSGRGASKYSVAQVPMPLPPPTSRFADRFAPPRPPTRQMNNLELDVPRHAQKSDPKLANAWKTKAGRDLSEPEILAMPESEYMNEKQLEFFRAKLQALKDDLLSNAGETTEHLREDTSIVPDPADRATIEEEHALELRTRDRERKLLKKISQSLARIESGDYGFCDETGEPIGLGRLIARPTATLSLEAQQRRELKQKMFGD
jgi:DnaK suppressor protein